MNESDHKSLYCVGLTGFTWLCGLSYTGINLQTPQDKELISLSESKVRGGTPSVLGDRYVESNEKKK